MSEIKIANGQKNFFPESNKDVQVKLDHLYGLKKQADRLIDERNKTHDVPISWAIRWCEITNQIKLLEEYAQKKEQGK